MLIITAMLTTTCVVVRRVLQIRRAESFDSHPPKKTGAALLQPQGKPLVRDEFLTPIVKTACTLTPPSVSLD
jgi:hypothetical protein